jgi:hypothetical protein
MAVTTNKGLYLGTVGGDSGTWGGFLDTLTITPLDVMMGGTDSVSLSASNYTLSASEIQNLGVKLSGTLLASVTVWTSNIGFFYVENNCTGNFTVTLQAISAPVAGSPVGSTFVLPQGVRGWFVSDATVGIRPAPSWLPTLVLAISGSILLSLRRTENNTSPQTVLSVQSGNGSGNAYTLSETGDGSNNVATVTEAIGATTIGTKTAAAYGFPIPMDLTEILTPSAPASSTLRMYSKSSDQLAVQGSSGIERIIGVGLPGANVVTITQNAGTPNTKADVTVSGLAILVNANGQVAFVNAPGLITVNLGATGAAGMDTGSQPTTAPVYFYGIYNASTATWSVIGSATSPSGGGSSNLPSGYTFTVYLGSMMNDSNPHLRPSYQTGKRVTYSTLPAISGTVTYANFFPAFSEAALVQSSTATVTNDTWLVTDMNGATVFNMGSLPASSGEAITNVVAVANTGGTTFGTSGTGSSFKAYGWIERANVT